MFKVDKKKLLAKGPDLDEFLVGRKKHYTTYGLGASMYSMNYYSFVKLCKQAGAHIQVKKNVVIDLDILDAYIAENLEEGDVENEQKEI